jgi:hypothetical protein
MLLIAHATAQFQYPALEGDLETMEYEGLSLGLGWKPNPELGRARWGAKDSRR